MPLRIIYTSAPRDVLESRIKARAPRGSDPSEADLQVLERQFAILDEPQGANGVHVDTTASIDGVAVAGELRKSG